jgi:general stress protein CsbA
MLLFYGLSLVNVSKYTYSNVAWLGYVFVCLGIVDSFFEGYELLFWTIGFGGFHILYGVLFYLQYERKGDK